jgi:hypothetical protein
MPQHWVQALNASITALTAQSMKPPPVIVNTSPGAEAGLSDDGGPSHGGGARSDSRDDPRDGNPNVEVTEVSARKVTVSQDPQPPPRSASPAPPSSPKRNNNKAAQT